MDLERQPLLPVQMGTATACVEECKEHFALLRLSLSLFPELFLICVAIIFLQISTLWASSPELLVCVHGLEYLGRYTWTKIACGVNDLVQKKRSQFTEEEQLPALSKFGTLESWGHRLLFKTIPVIGGLLSISPVAGGGILALLIVAQLVTSGFPTPEKVVDLKQEVENL